MTVVRDMLFPDCKQIVEATTVFPSGKSFEDAIDVAKQYSNTSAALQTNMIRPEQFPTFVLLLSTTIEKTVSPTQAPTATHPKTASGRTPKSYIAPNPTVTHKKSIMLILLCLLQSLNA